MTYIYLHLLTFTYISQMFVGIFLNLHDLPTKKPTTVMALLPVAVDQVVAKTRIMCFRHWEAGILDGNQMEALVDVLSTFGCFQK